MVVRAGLTMPSRLVPEDLEDVAREEARWLAAFHAGSRAVMSDFYTTYFSCVERSVGRVLEGADRETVIHEVFCRLLDDPALRAGFRGGSVRAWISTVAHNHAIDYHRRRERERPIGTAEDVTNAGGGAGDAPSFEASLEARQLIERFRTEWLTEPWRRVFDARFLEQRPQSEAARILGIHRTTLLYQEFRIRQLLRKFFLNEGLA